MWTRTRSTASAIALLALPALAGGNPGNVVVVTNTDPAAFVAAAQDGDTLLFPPGNYGSMVISGKSLTLAADVGGAVNVGTVLVNNLASDQQVTLSGLNISAPSTSIPLRLENNAGKVWVQDGNLNSSTSTLSGTPVTASLVNCADVVFARCVLLGGAQPNDGASSGGHALVMTASNASAFDCEFTGGPGLSNFFISSLDPGEGGNALRMAGGTFFASGCSFTGGNGGIGALAVSGGSCGDGAAGGDALFLFAADPIARLKDCTLTGGIGGDAQTEPCVKGPDGQGASVLSGQQIDLPGTARTLTIPNPVREGETAQLAFAGEPGDLVFLVVALDQASTFNPLLGQDVTADPFFLLPMGTAGPTGLLNVPILISDFANPARDSILLREQGFFVSSSLELILDGAQSVLHLDSSF